MSVFTVYGKIAPYMSFYYITPKNYIMNFLYTIKL